MVQLVYIGGVLRMGSDYLLEMGSLVKGNRMCGLLASGTRIGASVP